MASKASAKAKEIDPEELMKRKFRAKCRFRALGRLCMANTFWLMESIDHYEGDDVKRRVEQAVRGKVKKQLLSVKDKALLNKNANERTDQEKKYLYRIIGGIKCFKRYPNNVKRKLVGHTYFQYYGPNRVVVREHQDAFALYFIVYGTVSVTQMVYDELLEQHVSQEIATMGAGEMFGEVSLLHNIPRTATVTTTDHCEFLQLHKSDFKNILQICVQRQWDEIRVAMSSFSYFDALSEVSFREGCIMAKKKNFAENETILGDGAGIPNYVYFILSGRVQMIEQMQVIVVERLGKKFYTLYDPYVTPEPSEQDFEKKWFSAYNEKPISGETSGGTDSKSRNRSTQTQSKMLSILRRSEIFHRPSEVSKLRVIKETSQIDATAASKLHLETTQSENKVEATTTQSENKVEATTTQTENKVETETADKAVGPDQAFSSQMKRASFQLKPEDEKPRTLSVSSGSQILLAPAMAKDETRMSCRFSVAPPLPMIGSQQFGVTSKLKTFFMQVCLMNTGSTFGFGENMRDRRIVATMPTCCMLFPKIWLLQHNTANIWTRIQYYLEKKIPNKKQLFDEFVKQREWEEYRKQVVQDVVARSNTVNYTTINDVPYSIRLEEMLGV